VQTKPVQFIFLVGGFIFATVIGTLTHEGGHYLMARMLGHEAEINYGATFLTNDEGVSDQHRLFITMAGPIETILTGTIGWLLLVVVGKKYARQKDLNGKQWVLIFISLFWLRPVANFIIWIGGYIFTGKFSDLPDEVKISRYFHLPDGFILLVTAMIGAIILAIVVFRFIPPQARLVFIGSGFVGGITGYILWLKMLGPIFLP
jgi:hypothetical protein